MLFLNKIKKGNLDKVTKVGDVEGIPIFLFPDKLLHSYFGAAIAIDTATIKLDDEGNPSASGSPEKVIIIGAKFNRKYEKSKMQAVIQTYAQRILVSGNNSLAIDDEVEARYNAMNETSMTGFFSKGAYARAIAKDEKVRAAAAHGAAKYAIKKGLESEEHEETTYEETYAGDEITNPKLVPAK